MTTSGLAAPPRAAPARPARPQPRQTPPARRTPPERASFERVLAVSFGASVLLHLLLLLLSPLVIQTDTPPSGAPSALTESGRPFGLEMIVAVPSENAPELAPIETRPDPSQAPPSVRREPAAPPGAAPGPTPPDAVAGGAQPTQPPGTGRNPLEPASRDPRLSVGPRPLPNLDTRTERQRYQDHLQARIDAINDSLGVVANRERRTADWTVTDGSGNRWGLAPDGLHLGPLTIPREVLPLPAPTGDNRSLEEDRERQRQRGEIQRQEAERQRRETERERIDAMREAQGRATGSSGGS